MTEHPIASGCGCGPPVPRAFYERPTTEVAHDLVGCVLARRTLGVEMAGVIVETEAYGPDDLASHAARGQTRRNAPMYGPPGHAYVYLIYGRNWCLNAVTRPVGVGEAVLLRALQPVCGLERIRQNRQVDGERRLCNGPGNICRALQIDGSQNGWDLACDPAKQSEALFICFRDGDAPIVTATRRVGITKSADLEWRYVLTGSPFVSRR